MAWLRIRERFDLADEYWAALYLLPLLERAGSVPRVALASTLGVVIVRETLNPAGMYTDPQFMAWLRIRARLGLADEDWAALCLLPLVERADSVHSRLR